MDRSFQTVLPVGPGSPDARPVRSKMPDVGNTPDSFERAYQTDPPFVLEVQRQTRSHETMLPKKGQMPDAPDWAYQSQPPTAVESHDAGSSACSPAREMDFLVRTLAKTALGHPLGHLPDRANAPPRPHALGNRPEICQGVHANHHRTRHDPTRPGAPVVRPCRSGDAFRWMALPPSRLLGRAVGGTPLDRGKSWPGLAGSCRPFKPNFANRQNRHRRANTACHPQEALRAKTGTGQCIPGYFLLFCGQAAPWSMSKNVSFLRGAGPFCNKDLSNKKVSNKLHVLISKVNFKYPKKEGL